MTLRFRPLAEVVENASPEGRRSKNAPCLRGFANLCVNGRVGTHPMHHFSVGSGTADGIAGKSII